MISTEILELMLVCIEDDVWASGIRNNACITKQLFIFKQNVVNVFH